MTEENLRNLVRMVNEEMEAATSEHRQQLDTILAELADVGRRLEPLYHALETASLTMNDLVPRIQALRMKQEQLQSARNDVEAVLAKGRVELADLGMVVKHVADLRSLLMESSFAEQRPFIRGFVKEIKVTGKEVALTYQAVSQRKGLS